MKPIIIFLNGSINAGKSTVAKLLAKELPNTALIEIDALREMIGWMPIDQSISFNLENALSIITNFSKRNLNMVVPYPLSQKNYDFLMENLKDLNTDTRVFTLAPQLEKVLTNRGTRELDDWERERIKHHYVIGIPNPSFGEIIDNSNQTPEETAKYILSRLDELQS
ncbi:MAG: zeta toxin family protein [Candidatus Kaiserbacteria bacterium]|nr:zeta toxin family protein [Candidatus Kaiserbacteria bacterium]